MGEKEKEGNPSILVMITALNEESGIGPTLAEINEVLKKPLCLIVDGRSTDRTIQIAEEMGAQVIFQKGFGKGDAIATGLEHIKTFNVDYLIIIDADFTYPAKYLPEMIKILEENPSVGMVCGNRFNSHFHLENMANVFYTGNRLIAFVHDFLNGVQMHDPLTGMRVIRWELLKDWNPKSKGFDIEVELNHYVERKNYNNLEIPIFYRARVGEKKLRLRHGFPILMRILAEALV